MAYRGKLCGSGSSRLLLVRGLDALTLLLEWLNCDTFDGTVFDLYRRSAVARDVIVSFDHRAATRLEIDRRTSQDKGPEGKKRERKQHSESRFEV